METLEQREKLKREFENNLKQAVCNCKILMVRNHSIENFVVTPSIGANDLDGICYEDGEHNYSIGASIRIYKSNGEFFEKGRSRVSFSAKVDGKSIRIDNDVIIAENNAFTDSEITQLNNEQNK